jgi:hypothetical protein
VLTGAEGGRRGGWAVQWGGSMSRERMERRQRELGRGGGEARVWNEEG